MGHCDDNPTRYTGIKGTIVSKIMEMAERSEIWWKRHTPRTRNEWNESRIHSLEEAFDSKVIVQTYGPAMANIGIFSLTSCCRKTESQH